MTRHESTTEAILRVAHEQLGFAALHPGQLEAIQAVLAGRDTLVVMPTGAGKSAIYQIATLLLDGPAVVISPLLALQRDQIDAIEAEHIGEAAAVNSTLGAGARRETMEMLQDGTLRFLFLAPEQFGNEEVLAQVRNARPVLFVVDEAHCISEWGHDFRPDYLRLSAVIEALGHPTTLALTATAAPPVRQEIVERLGMREAQVIAAGFDRPNIWLGVESFTDEEMKQRTLLERVEQEAKPGIVYVATRKHAEEVAAALRRRGVQSAFYHAGMKHAERDEAQAAFMNGDLEVMVATIAFGMGIDKPDVRFVFHHDISDAVDAYYQEIGRAGRDGRPARAVLFYRSEDVAIHLFQGVGGHAHVEDVEVVATAIHEHRGPISTRALRGETGLSQTKLLSIISRLADVGALALLPSGEVEMGDAALDIEAVAEEVARRQEQHRAMERSRIEMMRGYAEVLACRREYLLNYFGETLPGPCGYCDNCEAGIVAARTEDMPFPLQSAVVHTTFGRGIVQRYEADKMVVLFDTVGYKTLSVQAVIKDDLLRRVDE